jgi:hypothetical protein
MPSHFSLRVLHPDFTARSLLQVHQFGLLTHLKFDFHCQTSFIDLIAKKYPDIEENEIKKLVWYNSSSINSRVPHTIYNPEQWKQIELIHGNRQSYEK